MKEVISSIIVFVLSGYLFFGLLALIDGIESNCKEFRLLEAPLIPFYYVGKLMAKLFSKLNVVIHKGE